MGDECDTALGVHALGIDAALASLEYAFAAYLAHGERCQRMIAVLRAAFDNANAAPSSGVTDVHVE